MPAFLIVGTGAEAARLRELRALSLVFCGFDHSAMQALHRVVADPTTSGEALAAIDRLPALQRRLACFGKPLDA
jgi:hypothetical protein